MVILTNFFISYITNNNNNYFLKSCTEQLVQKSSSCKTDGGISSSFVESQKFAGKKLSIGINSSLPIGITLQSLRSRATSSQQVKSPPSLLVFICPPLYGSSFDLQFEQSVNYISPQRNHYQIYISYYFYDLGNLKTLK